MAKTSFARDCLMRTASVSAIAALILVVGCRPDTPQVDPAVSRPRVDTADVTIEDIRYTFKIDGTLHSRRTPINLAVTSRPASKSPPAVTHVELIVTPERSADEATRTRVSLRWIAREGWWEAEIRNAFPDAEDSRAGRFWTPGPYVITIELYDGERLIGRAGPIEVYLHFVRTSG
jgi:hypothetical protein